MMTGGEPGLPTPGRRHDGPAGDGISTPGAAGPQADGNSNLRAGRLAERADLLAWLRRRAANAALVGQRYPESESFARDRQRQIEVMIEDIANELHLGAALVEARLEAGQ